jgi:hypothetical protein
MDSPPMAVLHSICAEFSISFAPRTRSTKLTLFAQAHQAVNTTRTKWTLDDQLVEHLLLANRYGVISSKTDMHRQDQAMALRSRAMDHRNLVAYWRFPWDPTPQPCLAIGYHYSQVYAKTCICRNASGG